MEARRRAQRARHGILYKHGVIVHHGHWSYKWNGTGEKTFLDGMQRFNSWVLNHLLGMFLLLHHVLPIRRFPVYSVYRLSRKRLLPSKDSIFYDINAVSTCMWFMVNLMTYFMLMSGSDKEQKSFALYRMGVTALLQIPLL